MNSTVRGPGEGVFTANPAPCPVITPALLGLILGVALFSHVGRDVSVLAPLFINSPGAAFGADLARGQVWRLFTPILLHFGWLHLGFNLLAFVDLGVLVESRLGAARYGALIAVAGAAGNLAQYAITGNALFGGASGIIYALLGYAWTSGTTMAVTRGAHRATIGLALTWFALGWTGVLGPIANWTHATGLLFGLLSGVLLRRWRQRPQRGA